MTLVSELIQDAYRESDLISINAIPTAAETAEALRLLNRVYLSVYGNEAGEELSPLPLGSGNVVAPSGFPDDSWARSSDEFIPLNSRLVLNLTTPTTVNLHPLPQPGSRFAVQDVAGTLATAPLTIKGNGRRINGVSSLLLSTPGANLTWFYRDDLGEWQLVESALTASSVWPFPPEFDSLFIVMLAMRLNPRNGTVADSQSIAEYKRVLGQFKARYRQVIQTGSEQGLVRMSQAGMNNVFSRYNNSTTDFNVGIPWGW